MGIHDDDIERVRNEADIVAIISQYVALKKTGGQNWSGLCPFHNEKTPSFSVSADKGFYYCFGCQQSGDVIKFVEELEGLDFPGAMEWLAPKVGITLRYTEGGADGRKRAHRKKLTDVIDKAVDFYNDRLLTAPDAGQARGYLRSRGYDKEIVQQFRLGYSPDDWDQLAKNLGVPARELEATGLGFTNKRQRQQDFFRGRVMFPIFDANGAAVGFGGRQMPGGQPPKYKNTSETEVYKKSHLLYGLNWAKRDAVSSGEIIVCEGYTDVIGFFRADLPRAVATCGTALTEDHVKLMKRFAPKVILAFDADGAGRSAADRFYEWEKQYEIEVFVADLPDGVDPGDLSATDDGRERLRSAVTDALPFLKYRIERALGSEDLSAPEGRAKAAEKAMALVAEHPNELLRDQYLMEVASRTRTDPDRLRPMLRRSPQRGGPGAGRGRGSSGSQRGPGDYYGDPYESANFVPDGGFQGEFGHGPTEYDDDGPAVPALRFDRREAEVIKILIHRPADLEGRVFDFLFDAPGTRRAYEVVASGPDWAGRLDDEPEQVASLLRRLSLEPLAETDEGSSPVEDLGWVVGDVANRVLRDVVGAAAADTEKYKAIQPLVQWTKLRTEELSDATARVGAIDALLAWLQGHFVSEQGDQGGSDGVDA